MGLFKKYVYTLHGKDAAPMMPLIDTIPFYQDFACIPVPLRVDKVINGDLTTFILPNKPIFIEISESTFYLNLLFFMNEIVRLLSKWAVKIVEEKFHRNLPEKRIIGWFDKTFSAYVKCPSLSEDLGEILQFYMDIVFKSYIEQQENLIDSINAYITHVISLCKNRIKENSIEVIEKDENLEYQIIEEEINQKNIFDPNIKGNTIPVDVLINNKRKTMKFRPFLIYQDLLESFTFNKKRLNESMEFIHPKILVEKKIIQKIESKDQIADILYEKSLITIKNKINPLK
ncbi:MAG: hypothetical protein ACTSYR_05340 [Candidatus Odinarchaeia archaeon]